MRLLAIAASLAHEMHMKQQGVAQARAWCARWGRATLFKCHPQDSWFADSPCMSMSSERRVAAMTPSLNDCPREGWLVVTELVRELEWRSSMGGWPADRRNSALLPLPGTRRSADMRRERRMGLLYRVRAASLSPLSGRHAELCESRLSMRDARLVVTTSWRPLRWNTSTGSATPRSRNRPMDLAWVWVPVGVCWQRDHTSALASTCPVPAAATMRAARFM